MKQAIGSEFNWISLTVALSLPKYALKGGVYFGGALGKLSAADGSQHLASLQHLVM
jgi:hypothetical protein